MVTRSGAHDSKIDSAVRYLGVEVDDAHEIAEKIDVSCTWAERTPPSTRFGIFVPLRLMRRSKQPSYAITSAARAGTIGTLKAERFRSLEIDG